MQQMDAGLNNRDQRSMTTKTKTAGDKRRTNDKSEEDGDVEKTEMSPAMTSSRSPNRNTVDDDADNDGGGSHVNAMLDNFASDTSLPGIARVYNASNRILRLFWIFVIVICVAMFIWGISEHLERYFRYPKKVTVELVSDPVPFPAVTICSLRGFDFDVLNTMHELVEKDPASLDHLNRTVSEEPPFVDAYLQFLRRFSPMWVTKPQNGTILKAMKEVMSRTGLYAHIYNGILSSGGIKAEQFIATCIMAGDECNITRDFKLLFDHYYFNCYTYYDPESTEQQNKSKNLPWLIPGFDNGLSMVLLTGSGMLKQNARKGFFPGIFDPDSPVSGGDGVRVIIHDPQHEPLPQAEGFDVPNGFYASFGIRPRLNKRIGKPHGNCRSDELHMLEYNITYRQFFCQQLCVQKYIFAKCKCLDETLPLPHFAALDGLKYCHDTKKYLPEHCSSRPDAACFDALLHEYSHMECAWKSRDQVRRNWSIIEECDCRPNCNELLYDVTYSLSTWPADGFEGELAINDIMEVRNFTRAHFTERQQKLLHDEYETDQLKFMRDFSKINVYISAPEVLVTRETPGYKLSELISDIGGQQGIWLGLSLITVAEVVQLIGQIFSRVFISKRRQGRNKPNSPV